MDLPVERLADLKDEFLARGFCIVRGVIDAGDVASIKSRLRYIAAHPRFYRRLGVFFAASSAAAPAGDSLERFEQIGNVPFLDAECRRRLLLHPRLVDLVRAWLGPDVNVINAGFFLKPAQRGAEVPWHQDAATWGVPVGAWTYASAPPIFDYWMALDAAGRDNGCLEVLPGSHRSGGVAHAPRGGLLAQADPADLGFDPARRLAIPAEPGDVVIYHQDMFHRSGLNLSSRPRLAAAGTFVGLAEVPRLRALLPPAIAIERRPALRGGRPVEIANPLPTSTSPAAFLRCRLRRGP